MNNIKNIVQIPDNLLLSMMRFTGEIDRFACTCKSFKRIKEKNKEHYLNITLNCNIFGKLQKILESDNELYLKMFWNTLSLYQIFQSQTIGLSLLNDNLLSMIVKFKSVSQLIRINYMWSDFKIQCTIIKLIGKYKDLNDIKIFVKTNYFIVKSLNISNGAGNIYWKHYTWQCNLAIGLYESGKYDKIDYLYSNLSFDEQKLFPYYGFNPDGSGIHNRYIKALCKWVTFENFKHIKNNGKIIVEGNEIIIPKFKCTLDYIRLAKGLCGSENDDTRILKLIDKKSPLPYSSLLHISVFYQNINIINWLVRKIVKEIKYIKNYVMQIKAYNTNNIDTGSAMQNYLDDFIEIGEDVLLAYGCAIQYPNIRQYLMNKFNKYHHLLFEEETLLQSTNKFEQIYGTISA